MFPSWNCHSTLHSTDSLFCYVLSKRAQTEIGPIRCEQSDTCQKKSLPQFLFLQTKGQYEVPYKKKKEILQNCLALMKITMYI